MSRNFYTDHIFSAINTYEYGYLQSNFEWIAIFLNFGNTRGFIFYILVDDNISKLRTYMWLFTVCV
jgi:hypothetical protein